MRFSLVFAALLCLTTWMSMVNATHGPVASCCDVWSTTKVQLTRIQDYRIQSEGACPIRAVVFQTTAGRRICSDPDNGWAKKAIRKVDEERKNKELQEKQRNEEGPISSITPAATSQSKNIPKTRRSKYERRRKRIKFARKRKGQRKRV